MRVATIARELVGPWSATAYLALARRNRGWWDLGEGDRDALKRLAVEADDRGHVAVPRQKDPGNVLRRLADAGFLRVRRRRGFTNRYALGLPRHVGFLVALDARRLAFAESTPSGFAFYDALGYGAEWRRGRARVAAAVARVRRGRRGEPRESLEP